MDAAPSVSKLAGIIGHRVQHEECQHSVCLQDRIRGIHLQFYALHLESRSAFPDDIEEFLQRETLYLQAQFSLAELYPVGQYLIVVFYLIGQFADVSDACLSGFL